MQLHNLSVERLMSQQGARANALVDGAGEEPTFEAVLRAMHSAGYTGGVYPPPALWRVSDLGLFARYPFAGCLDALRAGGF